MATEDVLKNLVRRAPVTTDSQKAVSEYLVSKQEERDIK